MYKAWHGSGDDMSVVTRRLEAHLNEFAEEVISVSYAISTGHHILAVYRTVEVADTESAAVVAAEEIIDGAHA